MQYFVNLLYNTKSKINQINLLPGDIGNRPFLFRIVFVNNE